MVLSRTRLLLIGGNHFPALELQVQVLSHLSQHVDEQKVVIEHPVVIFTPKTEDSVIFELVTVCGVEVIGLDDLVSGDALVGLCLVADSEDEGVQDGSSCESDEDEILVEPLLLVEAATDHESAAEEGRGVMLYIQSAPRPQPLLSLQIEGQNLSIEPLPFISLEAHPTHDHHVPLVDLNSVKTRRHLRRIANASHLYPLPRFMLVPVEERQSFKPSQVESAQQVDLFLCSEESGVVPDSRKE